MRGGVLVEGEGGFGGEPPDLGKEVAGVDSLKIGGGAIEDGQRLGGPALV